MSQRNISIPKRQETPCSLVKHQNYFNFNFDTKNQFSPGTLLQKEENSGCLFTKSTTDLTVLGKSIITQQQYSDSGQKRVCQERGDRPPLKAKCCLNQKRTDSVQSDTHNIHNILECSKSREVKNDQKKLNFQETSFFDDDSESESCSRQIFSDSVSSSETESLSENFLQNLVKKDQSHHSKIAEEGDAQSTFSFLRLNNNSTSKKKPNHLGKASFLNLNHHRSIRAKVLSKSRKPKSMVSTSNITEPQHNCIICNKPAEGEQGMACFSICEHYLHEMCLLELVDNSKFKSTNPLDSIFCPLCYQI